MKKRMVNTGLRQIRLVQNEMKGPGVPDKGYAPVKNHVLFILTTKHTCICTYRQLGFAAHILVIMHMAGQGFCCVGVIMIWY